MSNTQCDVASADIRQYIDGLAELIEMKIAKGFEPYMISFMFQFKSMDNRKTGELIESEIDRVFGRFITEVARNPWSKKNRRRRPILIACPDWPAPNNTRSRKVLKHWEGVHAGGVLLIPVRHRLKTGVKDHFETVKKSAYVRPGFPLSRIHIEHIEDGVDYVTDYCFKALKRRKCSFDDIIVHPQARSERSMKPAFDAEADGPPGAAWDVWGRGSLRHLAHPR